MRSVLHDLLSGLGYAVDEAPGGAEGLVLFREGGYDLVLTDLAMPGMSGWEVAEATRSMSAATPVVLVTGSATDVNTERADAQGLTLLHKPVPLLELRAAVRQALENPRPEPSRGVTSGLPHKTASPRCDSQQTGGI